MHPSITNSVAPSTSFDANSGSVVETVIFNHRPLIAVLCAAVTAILGYQAWRLQLVDDLAEGVRSALSFFTLAVAIATIIVFWYTRCVRSTGLVVSVSLVAIVWQFGLLPTFGLALDPYSILVPFLVFAVGMSHGAQAMDEVVQDVGRGVHELVAARMAFRWLFLAGLTALLVDAVGFAVLLVVDIQPIRELAIATSLGVAVLIFTNVILLPVLLSYIGVSAKAARHSLMSGAAVSAVRESQQPAMVVDAQGIVPAASGQSALAATSDEARTTHFYYIAPY